MRLKLGWWTNWWNRLSNNNKNLDSYNFFLENYHHVSNEKVCLVKCSNWLNRLLRNHFCASAPAWSTDQVSRYFRIFKDCSRISISRLQDSFRISRTVTVIGVVRVERTSTKSKNTWSLDTALLCQLKKLTKRKKEGLEQRMSSWTAVSTTWESWTLPQNVLSPRRTT